MPSPSHATHRLPTNAVSKDGFEFDPRSTKWKLSPERTIDLQSISEMVGPVLLAGFTRVLLHYAENYAAATTTTHLKFFERFLKFAYRNRGEIAEILGDDLLQYRASLSPKTEHYLGRLRSVFRRWTELGVEGLDESCVDLLDSWRLRGNEKGRAVQMRDPRQGPLSEMEFQALREKMTEAFENDTLNLEDWVLVELFISTGRRPIQLADLKISDLIESTSEDGLKTFVLSIPRRKQVGESWRDTYKPFALRPELGAATSALCRSCRERVSNTFGPQGDELSKAMPLFPDWDKVAALSTASADRWREAQTTQALRRSSQSISDQVKRVIDSLGIPSERTGTTLRVHPYRLRRTLADRAAREGFGELVIAELLDHSDTQQVKVYTENVPENAQAINRAMAHQLAPVAQAFAGVIVRDEEEATRGDDLASRVRSTDGGVGTCGNYSFCGAPAPIACYTCQHFQPWLDGPHEEVLEGLWAERERIQELTGDETMAAVNDRTLVAVTEVVQRCRVRLSDESSGGDDVG